MQSILTPPTLVLHALLQRLEAQTPALKSVFDPTLSIRESITGARAIRSTQGNPKDNEQFPLIGYSRTQITPMSAQTYRSNHKAMLHAEGKGGFRDVRTTNAQFSFMFRLYFRDILMLEQYELLYATRNFLTDVTTFDLALPFLKGVEMEGIAQDGTWPYHVQWEPLEDMQAEKAPQMSFSIAGRATINGLFLTADVENMHTVQRIILEIRSAYDNSLYPPPITIYPPAPDA